MTLPSRRNRQTIPSNIRPWKCCSVFAAFALLFAAGTLQAEDETRPEAGDLLRGLKDRSVEQRWNLLNRERGDQKPLPDLKPGIGHADEPRPDRTANRPSERPVPDPGPRHVYPPFPAANGGHSHGPLAAQPVPEPTIPLESDDLKSPADLPSLSSIDPFGDYRPKIPGQKEATRRPETVWQSERLEQVAFEQMRRSTFANSLFTWEATNFAHRPLYFEDPALERYGHTYHELLQPAASIGRFGVQLAGLPYQMAIDPICKDVYTLGWYRPGECAPKLFYQIPWNAEAAAVQAGVTTGLFYLFP